MNKYQGVIGLIWEVYTMQLEKLVILLFLLIGSYTPRLSD